MKDPEPEVRTHRRNDAVHAERDVVEDHTVSGFPDAPEDEKQHGVGGGFIRSKAAVEAREEWMERDILSDRRNTIQSEHEKAIHCPRYKR